MKKLLFFASAVALLASCSKDLTEDVSFSVPAGKAKIVAYSTVEGETATRTHLEGKTYKWDNGDAIGVFVANDGDTNNAYFGYAGNENEFVGDFLPKGEAFYAYYPWDRNAAFGEDDTKIEMHINATQKHNRNYSSFAATEAPAVAYTETINDGVPVFNFKGLASYIHISVVGIGEVESIKLKVNGSKVGEAALNGAFEVDLSDLIDAEAGEYPEYEIKNEGQDAASEGQKEITLDMGAAVATLDMVNSKHFWFVVPAGLEFAKNDTIDFYVNDDEKPSFTYTFNLENGYTTKPNTAAHLCQKSATEENPFQYVANGAVLIDNAADLLWYLYYVENGATEDTVWEHDVFFNVTENSGKTYTLKPAILTAAEYDFKDIIERLYQDEYEQLGDAEKALYDFYVHPADGNKVDYYIPSIKYSEISGYKDATIKNLKIKGNGVFAKNEPATNVVKWEKIKLANVTVDASGVTAEADTKVHFLYSDLIAGVTVGEGCQLVVAANGKGALIDAVTVSEMPEAGLPEVTLPTYAGTETKIAYAYTLNIDEDVVWADYKDLDFVEKEITESGVVVTVADAEEAEEFFATEIDTEKAGYYSVVDETTSYWTGTVADKFAEANKIATAEELAFATSMKGQREKEYALVANIDLRKETWFLSHSDSKFTIDGANGKDCYTISNVVIDGTCASNHDTPKIDANAGHALFGLHADVKNLVVNGIEITVTKANEKTKVAALAGDGDAENVTVKGLTINTEDAAAVAYVGGLFAEYTADATVKGCTVEDATIEGSAAYGDLAGKFTIEQGEEKTKTVKVNKDNAGVEGTKTLFGQVWVDVTEYTQSAYTNLYFNGFEANVLPVADNIEYKYATTGEDIIHKFTMYINNDKSFEKFVEPKVEPQE